MNHVPTAAAVMAALVLGACGGDDPGPERATASVVDPTATASATVDDPSGSGASPTGPAATAGPTSGQPGGASDPSTDTSSPTSEPDPDPGGVDPEPIPTGTYRYATDGWTQLGNGPQEPMPSTTTLSANAPSSNRQVTTRNLRDEDGYGQEIRRVIEFTDAEFLLHEVRTDATVETIFGDVNDRRTFTASPPGDIGAPDSDVGWTNTFTMDGDGTTLTVTVTVDRFENVTIGGQRVRAAVVTQLAEFSGELEGSSESTTWLRPRDLLPLREESSSEVTQSATGITQRSEYTAVLNALTPS